MLELLKEKSNKTYTENGAVTYKGTKSYCLDLFSTIVALRSADETEIVKRFIRAYNENPDMAMKILFYARDVRGRNWRKTCVSYNTFKFLHYITSSRLLKI